VAGHREIPALVVSISSPPANPPAWQEQRLARHLEFMWIGTGIALQYREAML